VFRAPQGQIQGGATQAMWCHRRGAPTQQIPLRRPEPDVTASPPPPRALRPNAPCARPLLILGQAPTPVPWGMAWSGEIDSLHRERF
jgi:hypothetical protein